MNGQIDAVFGVGQVVDTITRENAFRLKINNQDYYFSALGFEAAYNNLLNCVKRNQGVALPVVSESKSRLSSSNIIVGKPAEPLMPMEKIETVMAMPIDDMDAMTNGADIPPPQCSKIFFHQCRKKPLLQPQKIYGSPMMGSRWQMLFKHGPRGDVNAQVDFDNDPIVLGNFKFEGEFQSRE